MANPFDCPVTHYMSPHLAVGELTTTLGELARMLQTWNVSAIPIVDEDGLLAGVVSRSDLIRIGLAEAGPRWTGRAAPLPERRAEEVMTRDPCTVAPRATIREAGRLMHEHQIHRLFVVEGAELVGVVSTRDLAAAARDARLEMPLSTVMTQLVISVDVTAPIGTAIELLDKIHVTGLIVTEADLPIGMFTQLDALAGRDLPSGTPVEAIYDAGVICLPAGARLQHAAAHAAQLDVRRVVVCKDRDAAGVISGLDFARIACSAIS